MLAENHRNYAQAVARFCGFYMPQNDRSKLLFVTAVFGALAAYAWAGGSYGLDLVTKIMIYAIFALSLELIVGGAGLVSFGHSAFFGIGAYAAVLLTPHGEAALLVWLLPGALAAAQRLVVREAAVAEGDVVHRPLALGDRRQPGIRQRGENQIGRASCRERV